MWNDAWLEGPKYGDSPGPHSCVMCAATLASIGHLTFSIMAPSRGFTLLPLMRMIDNTWIMQRTDSPVYLVKLCSRLSEESILQVQNIKILCSMSFINYKVPTSLLPWPLRGKYSSRWETREDSKAPSSLSVGGVVSLNTQSNIITVALRTEEHQRELEGNSLSQFHTLSSCSPILQVTPSHEDTSPPLCPCPAGLPSPGWSYPKHRWRD